MALIRDIERDRPRQIIVAEGVESVGERDYLFAAGIDLMQGYLFARPAFMALPGIDPAGWPVH